VAALTLHLDAPLSQRLAALIRRERQTRFSGGGLGYLWAYVTPLVWIALVVAMFRFMNRAAPISTAPEMFVATGILPYVLFRQTITAMMRTVIANRYLLYFQPTTTAEILLAAALLELLNLFVTASLIFGLIILVYDVDLPANPLKVMTGMGLAWALGAGFGRFAAVLGQWSDSFARAVPLLMRPVFWVSGVFFTANELPGPARSLASFSPLFHAVELIREGFFLGFASPISSPLYPALVAISFYLLSLVIERHVRNTNRARHRI
jgi:ABC-type polysaccharide/polyol phosphate export permease